METKLYNLKGTETGSVALSESVFASKVHPQTINDVVKAQLNNERQGNASTKTRSEVTGSGKKLYRQKGTGRARQGDIKSPIHVGGGVIFGPTPRNFDQRPPKKMVRKAVIGILSEKASAGAIRVVEQLDFPTGKTKDAAQFLKDHNFNKVLCVFPELSENIKRATANLKNVKVVTPMHVNAVDLLKYANVAISDKALKPLEEVLSK